jgi:copper homeostasis protein CutC
MLDEIKQDAKWGWRASC